MTSILTQLSEATRRAAAAAGPAVVRVEAGWRAANGIVVGEGLILTNAHNVHDETVRVTFADGGSTSGTLAGVDADGDLAVVRAATDGVTPLASAPEGADLGDVVLSVAAAHGGSRVTIGFVSGVGRTFRGPNGRRISGAVEHTAPMAPGSSGSALVDSAGRLLGINTNRLGGGFYLAIPADVGLADRVATLAQGATTARPRLGVALAPADVARRMRRAVGLPELDGALVREVEPGSAAELADISPGDLIVGAGSSTVRDADDLSDALGAAVGGDALELTVVRGSEERRVRVVLEMG